jgi:hypothetical protein
MSSDETQETLDVQIANQIINFANGGLEDGMPVGEIAAGLRNAAANFSAFAFVRRDNQDIEPSAVVEEFVNLFTHYLEQHQPKDQPSQGLYQLVEQVKNEI